MGDWIPHRWIYRFSVQGPPNPYYHSLLTLLLASLLLLLLGFGASSKHLLTVVSKRWFEFRLEVEFSYPPLTSM